MVVIVTCKNEDPIRNDGVSVHNILHKFFRHSRAENSGVSGGIWPKFELIQAFMHVLVTCKNDDSIKNEGARVVATFSHNKSGDFSRRSRAVNSAVLGLIWPNFDLVLDIINVHVTCKNKEDPIKNKIARVIFPIITLRELSVAMETRVLI